MGIFFKSTCYCKGVNKYTHCKSGRVAMRPRTWATVRREVEEYLSEEPCAPGVTSKTLKLDRGAVALAKAYRGALGALHGLGAKPSRKNLEVVAAAATVLHELTRKPLEALSKKTGKSRLAQYAKRAGHRPRGKDAREVDETSDLLGQAYCRALAELEAGLKANDLGSALHHVAMLTEFFAEQLRLAAYAYPECTPDFRPVAQPGRR